LNSLGNGCVFGVDDAGYFDRRPAVEISGGVADLFGAQAVQAGDGFTGQEYRPFVVSVQSMGAARLSMIIHARSSASITASWNCGRTCRIAWFLQLGQVRFVSKVTESWRSGSIHSEVPV
jgi:hypothetical protein